MNMTNTTVTRIDRENGRNWASSSSWGVGEGGGGGTETELSLPPSLSLRIRNLSRITKKPEIFQESELNVAIIVLFIIFSARVIADHTIHVIHNNPPVVSMNLFGLLDDTTGSPDDDNLNQRLMVVISYDQEPQSHEPIWTARGYHR